MAEPEHCACCGAIIPEGRQVCAMCENAANGISKEKNPGLFTFDNDGFKLTTPNGSMTMGANGLVERDKDGRLNIWYKPDGTTYTPNYHRQVSAVPCKNCKHYTEDHRCKLYSGVFHVVEKEPDDYCSSGELRDDLGRE